MGSTSARVKNNWNEKNYERIYVSIPKGYGDKFKEYCKDKGVSVNSAIYEEIDRRMNQSNEDCAPSAE